MNKLAVLLLLVASNLQAAILPDPTFGDAGVVTLPSSGLGQFQQPALAVLPDHSVVLGYGRYSGGEPPSARSIAFTKLLPSGVVDASFGTGGTTELTFGGAPDDGTAALDVLRLDDGRLLLFGVVYVPPDMSGVHPVLARVLPDGTPDPTFNGGAPLRLPEDSTGRRLELLRHRDGVLVVSFGRPDWGRFDGAVITRVTGGGSIDAAFGNQGTIVEPAVNGVTVGALVLPDGGFQTLRSWSGAPSYNAWRRYRADGALDTPYGSNGERAILPGAADALHGVHAVGDRHLATGRATAAALLDGDGEVVRLLQTQFEYATGVVSAEPFGSGRFLVTTESRSGFDPPWSGTHVFAIDAFGNLDMTIADGGRFRPRGTNSVDFATYATVVDTPSRLVMARQERDGTVVAYRFNDVRPAGQRDAVAIPAAGPLSLALTALGLILVVRRRVAA